MRIDEDGPAEADTELEAMSAAYDALRSAWDSRGGLDAKARKTGLKALLKAVRRRRDALCEAVSADFGHRSHHETMVAELFLTVDAIKHALAHLDEWMADRPVEVSWQFQPGTAHVRTQAKGVVGIIAPWNYPVMLALQPLAAAIAAGNRVLLKPSEYTPRTAAVLTELLAEAFGDDTVRVVMGGAATGAAFSSLPLDHILFTGSTAVGRKVMRAAAENLTPVTLELGGKSPVIIHPSYNLAKAAKAIAVGKLLNAGQTCIAPDYVLVERGQEDAFAEAFRAAVAKLYPTIADNPNYSSIVNDRHYLRLCHLRDEAVAGGARIVECAPAGESRPAEARKLAPTVVLGASADAEILREEIFGPLLPVIGVDSVEQAVSHVNARPRPLALYYFDHSTRRGRDLMDRTISGGVCINDCLLHITQEDMPFGGVGDSGLGAYHGEHGFRTFSHERAVFRQARVNALGLFTPPYSKLMETLVKVFIGR